VGGQFVLRVAAPPVEGKATDEARRALAAMVGVPPSRVRLVRGGRSREKVFLLAGIEPETAQARLVKAAGG
jgi:uncharacterized protein YggU (UPF0235/DUF167 family)